MKEYKFKYMDEAMINEVQELWDNGHAKALSAYGYECANAGVTGYEKGCAAGSLLIAGAVGLGIATVFIIRKIKHLYPFK